MILKELAQIILDSKDIRTKTKKNYTGALARNIYPAYGNRPVISLSKFEVVKLLNSKGKVVDTGVIRYKASGEPYFVFDNFTSKEITECSYHCLKRSSQLLQ